MVSSNLYLRHKLTLADLKLMYPIGNLYNDHFSLAMHLTGSMLVEKMEWDEDDAVGETAFWLKVFSVPSTKEHKIQKLRFKREIYSAWFNHHPKLHTAVRTQSPIKMESTEKAAMPDPKPGMKFAVHNPSTASTSTVVATPLHVKAEATKRQHDGSNNQGWEIKKPKNVFEKSNSSQMKKVSIIKQPAATMEHHIAETDLVEEEVVETIHAVNGPSITDEEWAAIEASLHAGETVVTTSNPAPTRSLHTNAAVITAPDSVNKSSTNLLTGATIVNTHPSVPKPDLGAGGEAIPTPILVAECSATPGEISKPNTASQFKTKVTVNEETSAERIEMLKRYPCQHCHYKGITRDEMDEHKFTEHSDIYPIACSVSGCAYRAKQQWILKRHLISKHSSAKNFKCSSCEYQAKTELEVKRHIRSKHDREKWQCPYCEFAVDVTKASLKHKHMADAHSDYTNVHRCDQCNFYTSQRLFLVEHINNKHSKALRFTCDIGNCEFAAFSRVKCARHQVEVHGMTGRVGTSNKIHFRKTKQHGKSKTMKTINVVHKFYCSVCRMPFRFIQIAESHVAKSHSASEEAQAVPTYATSPGRMIHTCGECGLQFDEFATAELHVAQTYSGVDVAINSEYISDPNMKRTFIRCALCDFTCETWCGMKSHVRANHENKIYKCSQCDFITNAKNGLSSHVKLAHNPNYRQPTKLREKTLVSQANQMANIDASIESVLSTIPSQDKQQEETINLATL